MSPLRALRNVGAATVGDLALLGITQVAQLVGKDAYALYDELCVITGERHDPCMIDVFLSAVDQAEGGPAVEWWRYTEARKRHLAE